MQKQLVFNEFDGKIRAYLPQQEKTVFLEKELSKAFKKFYVDGNIRVSGGTITRFARKWKKATGISLVFDQYFFGLADYYHLFRANRTGYAQEAEILAEILRKEKIRTVLEIGCGTGELLAELGKRGFEVEGIDQSGILVKQAKARGVLAEPVDFFSFETTQKYDAILLIWNVLLYFKKRDLPRVLEKAWELLTENGLVLIEYRNIPVANFKRKLRGTRQQGKQSLEFRNSNRLFKDKFVSKSRTSIFENGKVIKRLNHPPVELAIFSPQELEKTAKKKGFSAIVKETTGFYLDNSPSLLCLLSKRKDLDRKPC